MPAAHIFVVLAAIVIAFQIALACGAPWGRLTWGGKHPGRLPPRMRIVAVVSVALLAAFAWIVHAQAHPWIWIVVGYSGLGVLANAATPSTWERILWLPVALGLLITSLLVATA